MQPLLPPDHKVAGTLAPLFALRGHNDLGIGDTSTLRELIDWAQAQGLGFVQMLPINQTGNDHSPYNLLSSMALEPLTISCAPEDLPDVPKTNYTAALHEAAAHLEGPVDYSFVQERKEKLLRAAAAKFSEHHASEDREHSERLDDFHTFCEEEASWLEPHALHQALITLHGGEVSTDWPEEHKDFSRSRLWAAGLKEKEAEWIEWEMFFHRYVQWIARQQWLAVKAYAAAKKIALVGDVPVGVSIYSTDVWTHPELFDLERSSGAPPERVFQGEPFTAQWGQNWGFPLYNWFAMSKDDFFWWRRRLRSLRQIFSVLRVDHALGFFRIYSFPWRPEHNSEFLNLSHEEAAAKTGGKLPGFVPFEDDTEEHRIANQEHGETLLRILAEETGAEGLIAEDLGEVPPYVRPVLTRMELAGFKIPQWERGCDNCFTPGSEYPRRSITTYATHDHPPLCVIWNELVEKSHSSEGWLADAARHEMRQFLRFSGEESEDFVGHPFDFAILGNLLRGLWKSNSWIAAVNINDLFGTEDRFNVPGTAGQQNWTARLAAPIQQWNTVHASAIATWREDVRKFRPWPPA